MSSQEKDARAPEQSGTGPREWGDLYDAADRAAQALAVVASALESRGSPPLYRSALEAHAYTSMLRAELRAQLRALAAAAERAAAEEGAP